jgi:hypothetical protein
MGLPHEGQTVYLEQWKCNNGSTFAKLFKKIYKELDVDGTSDIAVFCASLLLVRDPAFVNAI